MVTFAGGVYKDLTDSHIVTSFLQSAHRQVARLNPVPKSVLLDIHDALFSEDMDENNLVKLRDFTYILLSFTAFLRYDEASQVRRHHLHLYNDYMVSGFAQK